MRVTRPVPILRVAAAIAALAIGLALPAFAQDAPTQQQGPVQAAPAPTAETGNGQDAAVHRAALDGARAQLDQIENALTRQDLSDDDLQRLRQLLEAPAARIQATLTALTPKAEAVKARLTQLGPAPEAGAAPETAEISRERDERSRTLKELDDTIRLAKALQVQADQIRTTLTERRQAAFTRMIFQRTHGILSPDLWSRMLSALPGEFAALSTVTRDWLATLERRTRSGEILALLAALGIGLALHFARVRLLPHVTRRPAEVTAPSRLRQSVTALGIVLAQTVPVLAGALVLYLSLESIQLLPPRVAPIVGTFLTSLVFLAFVRALAQGLIAPGLPAWRLVPVQEGTARILVTTVTTGSALVLLFTTVERIAESIGADYAVLVFLRGVHAAAIAALLAATLHRTQSTGASDEACLGPYVPDSRAGGPLKALGWLVTAVIIIACLTGYIALATFLVEQVLWVATLAAVLFLLLVLVEETFEHAIRPDSRFALSLQTSLGLRRRALDQLSVLVGGTIRILLAIGAVVLVLAPWGIESSDLLGSLRSGLTGIQFGEVRLSPAAIAISIVTFLIVIVVTRAVQRWLDHKFLPATELDAGLRNSIRTAAGYIGFFIAVGLATAQMGLSLEKIAIVAGALSVGIGFGLQSVVNNFVSGLILLWERPIRVGDWVVVGEEQGYVRRINVRATEIETFDRAAVIVPNSNLISGVVKNWVHNNRIGRIIVPVGVSYDADPEEVARAAPGSIPRSSASQLPRCSSSGSAIPRSTSSCVASSAMSRHRSVSRAPCSSPSSASCARRGSRFPIRSASSMCAAPSGWRRRSNGWREPPRPRRPRQAQPRRPNLHRMTMVNTPSVRHLLRHALAAGPLALLAACSSPPQGGQQPAFYRSLASAGASVDAASAAGMISAYRRNHGLPPVAVDAALQREAEAEAERMAAADRPSSADAVKQRLAAAGVASPAVNLSAGYHTVAEAFSGWRESPQHDRTMLAPGATRLGIATAYAPGSKYKVYWALIVAGP